MPNKSKTDSDKPGDKPVKKSLLKPITATKKTSAPKKEADDKSAPKKNDKPPKDEKPKEPQKAKEVVNLIDDEGNTKPPPKPVRHAQTASNRVLTPISRIKTP